MLRLRSLACALFLLALPASRAAAQEPPAAPPLPPAAQPGPPGAQPAPPGAQPGPPGGPVAPPGYPQRAQPVYPQPGQPAYPQPGQQPGQPAYPQPGQQPAQPAYPQPAQPAYPQPAYPQPGQPVYGPGYPPPPPGYGPGYGPPGYGPPGYSPPGYGPPGYGEPYSYQTVPPPPPPEPPSKLRWSLRFDPFELIQRRMTFQAEVAVAGPFAIEVAPTWIWGSPYGGIDERGFAVAANAVFYLSGQAFRGMWLKAHFEYENYSATFANPGDETLIGQPQRLSSGIIGALFGDTMVIPRTGGFVLSGGIGVGVATAGTATLTSGSSAAWLPVQTTLYSGLDRVRLLGSLGLGVAF